MAFEHLSSTLAQGNSFLMYTKRLIMEFGTGNFEIFQGAFGAGDGSYTITPRWPNDVQRIMYTGYKKFHMGIVRMCPPICVPHQVFPEFFTVQNSLSNDPKLIQVTSTGP